jgi:hypothetical protein
MKNNILLALLASLIFCACKNNTKSTESKQIEEATTTKIQLKKLWESDTLFTTAESAIYDNATNMIYVSNIDGEPWGADGKGSIGKLGLDGKVVAAKWVIGLNAPKGLGIANGKLYVTDINQLVEIDIAKGKIVKKYDVSGSVGLNDVTSAPDGSIYFTDSKKGNVHLLKNGVVSTITQGLGGSNGILFENDRLMLGTWADSSLIAYNFGDKKTQLISAHLPQPDGIEAVGDGGYLVSTWKGMIHYVQADGKKALLLNTSVDSIGCADIDFVKEKSLLLIPTFFKNRVAAYELVK